MNTQTGGNLQLSQGLEVLAPKSGKAYAVPCDEWRFLKEKLEAVSAPPWILPAASFTLLGAAIATIISIISGSVVPGHSGNGVVIAWAVFATTGLVGTACLILAIKQHKMQRTHVSEVVRQMEIIERRFEQEPA